MSHYKVLMTVYVNEELKYKNNEIRELLRFRSFKSYDRYLAKLTRNVNQKHRQFISFGNSSNGYTIRIKDIRDIMFEIEPI